MPIIPIQDIKDKLKSFIESNGFLPPNPEIANILSDLYNEYSGIEPSSIEYPDEDCYI